MTSAGLNLRQVFSSPNSHFDLTWTSVCLFCENVIQIFVQQNLLTICFRKAEKERYKARKKACRERGVEMGPTRKQLRHNKMSKSKCKVRVVIDCDFDDYMADKVQLQITIVADSEISWY